ncbi:response regulator transcription factor [Kitasatospora sp. GP82]|uniref:response regulator transcription factor n=1 Tax=Kitasatospora sp. GP82 TaxID=3035089 RepID=UPI0024761C4B|nr:response regulator transcription factor [Kitasatospora sp. GP82]MDH6127886.1 DNA-binding NarL/FixJ family response regulator [Kitasatospora sp. GP82]
MGRIRVLVVDDHRIFAEALAATLAAESDVEVGAAGSALAAERALEHAGAEGRAFDVVLIDADLAPAGPPPRRPRPLAEPEQQSGARRIPAVAAPRRLPGLPLGTPHRVPAMPIPSGGHPAPTASLAPSGDGLALLARVCRTHPALRAVVLAAEDDPGRAVRALQAGACGWVAKDSSLPRLMTVIRGVLRDETHLPPALLTGVVRELTSARRDRTESERLVETLTPREEEVLRCMVAGLGRQAVAERLYLSPHTVRTHMQNVLGKLGVHSTLAAVAVARRAGVSPSEPPLPATAARPGPG